MENTEAIAQLLSASKAEREVLINQKKTINSKIEKLSRIIQECEASLIIFAKYSAITSSGSDYATLIAEDNLRLMDSFEKPEMKALVQESINEVRRQVQNVAVDLLKREEAMGVRERTVNEVATVLTEQGDQPTADIVKQIAIDEGIVEKL